MSGLITALEIQQGNQERVNVFIDHQFAFALNIMDAAGLKKGQALTDNEIADLKARDTVVVAFEKALRFLASRPRSIAEVRQNLQEKAVDSTVIEAVISRLADYNYVNDREFALFWLRSRAEFNPKGIRALRYELRQKGVDADIIDEVLEELDTSAGAYQAGLKKARSLRQADAATFRTKLGAYLARRGFDYDTIREAVERLLDERATDDSAEDEDGYLDEE